MTFRKQLIAGGGYPKKRSPRRSPPLLSDLKNPGQKMTKKGLERPQKSKSKIPAEMTLKKPIPAAPIKKEPSSQPTTSKEKPPKPKSESSKKGRLKTSTRVYQKLFKTSSILKLYNFLNYSSRTDMF